METSEIISEWRITYREYLFHHGIKDDVYAVECWVSHTNNLIDYWHKQDKGELQKVWKCFSTMLIDYTNHYKRINENYRRNSRMEVTVKGTGGRYWK